MFAGFVTCYSWNKAPIDRLTTQTGHPTEAGQTRSLERMLVPKVNWCSQPDADNPERPANRSVNEPTTLFLVADSGSQSLFHATSEGHVIPQSHPLDSTLQIP